MPEMYDNYKLIEFAKERAIRRTDIGITETTPEDMVGKIEWSEDGERSYYNGFEDYNGSD